MSELVRNREKKKKVLWAAGGNFVKIGYAVCCFCDISDKKDNCVGGKDNDKSDNSIGHH